MAPTAPVTHHLANTVTPAGQHRGIASSLIQLAIEIGAGRPSALRYDHAVQSHVACVAENARGDPVTSRGIRCVFTGYQRSVIDGKRNDWSNATQLYVVG